MKEEDSKLVAIWMELSVPTAGLLVYRIFCKAFKTDVRVMMFVYRHVYFGRLDVISFGLSVRGYTATSVKPWTSTKGYFLYSLKTENVPKPILISNF